MALEEARSLSPCTGLVIASAQRLDAEHVGFGGELAVREIAMKPRDEPQCFVEGADLERCSRSVEASDLSGQCGTNARSVSIANRAGDRHGCVTGR